MKVELLHATPLEVVDIAICKCYSNKPHNELEKIQARITKVANVSKHSSTIEHLNYSFDIDGISRAVLQELARHRIASYTVKSTRYTLKELRDGPSDLTKYLVMTPDQDVNKNNEQQLMLLVARLQRGAANDIVKYMLPEAYKTSLVMTINARSLQNFLELRTSKHALKEIQELARAMFEVLPSDHKFLFRSLLNDI